MRRAAPAVLAAALVLAVTGCGGESGGGVGKGSGALTVYLSVPLSGAGAAQGGRVAKGAEAALAKAGGRAGDRNVNLVVVDDTGGSSRWSPVAAGANARRATEDAGTIAYIGDLEPGATATSLPITDSAEVPQVVVGELPTGLDVKNIVELPPGSGADPGAAAMTLVLDALRAAGSKAGDREAVRDSLRAEAAGGPAS